MTAAARPAGVLAIPAPRGAGPVGASFRLRSHRGQFYPLDVRRWFGNPEPADEDVLARAVPPVVDLGCGPGRHALALVRRGTPALGVDIAPRFVRIARARGVPVVRRSVFDPLPGEGAWGTALLLDGNVGIGGDPAALLARVRALLRTGGRVLAEVDRPGVGVEVFRAAIEVEGVRGPWFPWARVGVDAIATVAARAGLRTTDRWSEDGRWFARLDRR